MCPPFVRALQPELPGLGKASSTANALAFLLRRFAQWRGPGRGSQGCSGGMEYRFCRALASFCHGRRNTRPLACRQAQARGARGLKVVQVAQVWRHRPQGCGQSAWPGA